MIVKKPGIEQIDLCFDGFNFTIGLLALILLRNKYSVGIMLKKRVAAGISELSSLYPIKISATRKAVADIEFIMKCSSLFPHLFFPKRTLMLFESDRLNTGMTSLVDQLLKRDREMATLPANTLKLKNYSEIPEDISKGNFAFEFEFDRERATKELLLECIKQGLMLFKYHDENLYPETKLIKIHDDSGIQKYFEISYPYQNPIRVCLKQLSLVFNPYNNGIIVQIVLNASNAKFKGLADMCLKVFQQLDLEMTKEVEDWFQLQEEELLNRQITTKGLSMLRSETMKYLKQINHALNIQASINLVFDKYRNDAINSETFRLLQHECDEKYDLAKQTGISFLDFSRIFYRYRKAIDHMIDSAYNLMNQSRDPKLIWEIVEKEFLDAENEVIERAIIN